MATAILIFLILVYIGFDTVVTGIGKILYPVTKRFFKDKED